jgi:hypothetical protein
MCSVRQTVKGTNWTKILYYLLTITHDICSTSKLLSFAETIWSPETHSGSFFSKPIWFDFSPSSVFVYQVWWELLSKQRDIEIIKCEMGGNWVHTEAENFEEYDFFFTKSSFILPWRGDCDIWSMRGYWQELRMEMENFEDFGGVLRNWHPWCYEAKFQALPRYVHLSRLILQSYSLVTILDSRPTIRQKN